MCLSYDLQDMLYIFIQFFIPFISAHPEAPKNQMKSFSCGSINFQVNYPSDIFITECAGLEFMRRLSLVVKMELIKPANR